MNKGASVHERCSALEVARKPSARKLFSSKSRLDFELNIVVRSFACSLIHEGGPNLRAASTVLVPFGGPLASKRFSDARVLVPVQGKGRFRKLRFKMMQHHFHVASVT